VAKCVLINYMLTFRLLSNIYMMNLGITKPHKATNLQANKHAAT